MVTVRSKNWTMAFVVTLMGQLLSAPFAAAQDKDRPYLINVCVLDTSGSMQGERIEVSRKEIKQKTGQLPPSPVVPWVVVPFNSQAYDVRIFTNGTEEIHRYLDQLSAGGGTSIASGLKRAIEEVLQRKDVPHVAIYLYTDGEDSNKDGVEAQQQQLDQLFRRRTEQGLSQTVILRRWGSANADLVARLKQGGNSRVIDAGEARLVHATFVPNITVEGQDWKDAGTLAVDLIASVAVRGQQLDDRLPPLTITCTMRGVQGNRSVQVMPGPDTVRLQLRVPLDPNQAPRELRLPFEVSAPQGAMAIENGLLVPTLAKDRLEVAVPVPRLNRRTSLAGNLSVDQQDVRWVDPLQWKAEAELRLEIECQSEVAIPYRVPVAFSITSGPGVVLLKGSDRFTVEHPGKIEVPISVSFSGQQPQAVTLAVQPVAPPQDLKFEPVPLTVDVEIPQPPRVVTTISVSLDGVSGAHWVKLRDGLARFDASLIVRGDGPLPVNAPLSFKHPSSVRELHLSPRDLQGGEQQVRMTLIGAVDPAPAETTIELTLDVPSAYGAVHFRTERQSLKLRVKGPPPAKIVLSAAGQVSPRIELPLPEDSDNTVLTAKPVVLGVSDQSAAEGIQVRLRMSRDLQTAGPERQFTLFRDLAVPISPSGSSLKLDQFFVDSTLRGRVFVEPVPSTPAVVGGTHEVLLRREAPFKRILFTTLTVAFVALVLWLPWRLAHRLNAGLLPAEE